MENKRIYTLLYVVALLLLIQVAYALKLNPFAVSRLPFNKLLNPPDTVIKPDTTGPLPYPLEDEGYPFTGRENTNGLYLQLPSAIKSDVEYDPKSNQYILRHKIGDVDFRPPYYMSLEDYKDYDLDNSVREYWKERSQSSGVGSRSGIIPSIYIGGAAFDRIFGGNTIDIRPNGSVELKFGVQGNFIDNPQIPVRNRRTTNFMFDQNIQMNVIAKIGDKIEFKTNYNTQATFDFENKLNLRYEGKEDEIIKLIEAGDVTLPLTGTLISGSQSLFGIKTKLQFGKTSITAVYSEQESESSTITVQGGAQTSNFELKADEYEANKHFFIAHYFRDHYEDALKDLPLINSGINITKIEVWVTNMGAAVTENRNVVAFNDIGENSRIFNDIVHQRPGAFLPDNQSNTLFNTPGIDTAKVRDLNTVSNHLQSLGFVSGEDFEKIESARKLMPSEYTYNSKLGFITVNSALNADQSLAVAFQYQVIGYDSVFQVGEFSDQGITGKSCLMVKLLKSTYINIRNPRYDLMMKNIYSINAFQVNKEDFILNILYSGDRGGVPTGYFNEGPENLKGKPLIQIFNFDNLDPQLNPYPDGVFDYVDNAAQQGGTINGATGRIFFTVLEPFGSYLRKKFTDAGAGDLADKYCYDSLYTLTKTGAQQYPEKNKYIIEGFYKSASGSEISLNALNVPQGSVKVTAGGTQLTENVDYTVDYTLGRVRIINQGILNSGTPVRISLESNTMFSIQTKKLMGMHIDHDVTKNFHLGGTLLNLSEKPLTQKVNYGDDPISNTIWGFDYAYQTESRFITKLIDKLPLISTAAPSNVMVSGEFANFLPGHSRTVGKTGTSYIDDFEGTKSTIDLRNYGNWFLASTPQGQSADLFPEAAPNSGLLYGYNRAKISWYTIDPTIFYDKNTNLRPPNITNDELSKNSVRQILETEVFPNKDIPNGTPTNIAVLNVAYFPEERGPYNYDVLGIPGLSSGLNADGKLKDPETRWGGLMRKIETTDFEATNIEYIEFWMMDPFSEDADNSGQLYFNLGDISEDILRDSRKSYEHGLPTSEEVTDVDTTIWGRVPSLIDLVNSFDNEPGSREFQDVGYDGLRDLDELTFFDSAYLQKIAQAPGLGTGSQAFAAASDDPSGDNYHNFRGEDYDEDDLYSSVIQRYKRFNEADGNSPENTGSGDFDGNTRYPNVEDLNDDNTLSEAERYFQYRIDLNPNKMNVGENYITDVYLAQSIPLANNELGEVKWYQFKIPVSNPDKVVGNIQDFKSIRFMRMFMKNFKKPVVLRFATLDLVRGEWRKYPNSEDLLAPGEYIPNSTTNLTSFDVEAINIEENGKRYPIPYVIPPEIEQEVNIGTTNLTRLNEQSMVIKVCDLVDGDVRATYKTTELDIRPYKKLKMFVHAEKSRENEQIKYGDLTVFIRLGSDFTQNYYEYEVPLAPTPWGTSYTNAEAIWPENNQLIVDLEALVEVKNQRNIQMRNPQSGVTISFPYYSYDGTNRITVLGSPSISDVKAIMIGIRNPKKTTPQSDDDGEPKCAEIWVNELRLTDFEKKGGWAATSRVTINLADFGNLTVSGSYRSPNFGSLDQKINDIQKESQAQFDIATNLELGKFFPEKSGIRIPMHYDYSKTNIVPKYNPLNPDIVLKKDLESFNTAEEKDSVKDLTYDQTTRKNLNFMNVRKDRVGATKKPKIYDIENFNVSYSYSEILHKNIDIEYDLQKTHNGGFGYVFNNNPKNYKPFQKAGFISKYKALQLIRDFNFYILPKSFSFRTDMNRVNNERKLRKKSFGDVITIPTYFRTWDWNRIYDFKFDLSSSLSLTYNSTSNSYIHEPPGSLNRKDPDYQAKRDSIIDEILGFGTVNRFNQQVMLNYTVPINKLPMLDFMTIQTGYQATYSWTASPRSLQDSLGNTVQNNAMKRLDGNFDITKLYNRIPYLKKLTETQKKDNKDKKKQDKKDPDNPDPQDTVKVEKPKINYGKLIADNFLRIVIGLKKLSFQYTENSGTAIPGFMPRPVALGNDWNLDAPGLGFILGEQPGSPEYFREWLTKSTRLNTAYMKQYNTNMNFKATFEPYKDIKVELSAERAYSKNLQEFFVYNDSIEDFIESNRQETGTFSISFISWKTAFTSSKNVDESELFDSFKDYRLIIAERLARENPYSHGQDSASGYPAGYGPSSQYVLMPAFMAAYSGKSAESIRTEPFIRIPLPNWRISFSGLSKIPIIKQYFKSVTINHSYRCTYSLNSFSTNLNYQEASGNPSSINPLNGDFYPQYDFGQVTINEQFSPLINFDVTMLNSMTTKFEIKKTRNLSMSFVNNQLTETSSNEFVFGLGYRFKEVPFSFSGLGGGSKKTFKSDLNIKTDFSLRSNKTVLRRIDVSQNQVSAGQKVISINTSADYTISKSLNIRLFFDKIFTNPFLPSQFRNSNTNGGISLRFSLN